MNLNRIIASPIAAKTLVAKQITTERIVKKQARLFAVVSFAACILCAVSAFSQENSTGQASTGQASTGQASTGQAPTPTQQTPTKSEASSAAKQRLVFLLSTYHGAPSLEQLDEIGTADRVAALLREIAAHKSARPSMRLRAVDALGHYRDAASVEFLERAVASPDTLEVKRPGHAQLLRQHAMLSFARVRGEEAVATLVAFVEAKEVSDLQLRLAALTALGRFGGEAGRAELERLRAHVEHPVVKRTLNTMLLNGASNHFADPSSK